MTLSTAASGEIGPVACAMAAAIGLKAASQCVAGSYAELRQVFRQCLTAPSAP